MTNDEMRIAIAGVCGWRLKRKRFKNKKCPFGYRYEKDGVGIQSSGGLHGWGFHSSPSAMSLHNYTKDLNAMHEAEGMINVSDYIRSLQKVCRCYLEGEETEIEDGWLLAHATAAQRAEAFLRTVGKWKD